MAVTFDAFAVSVTNNSASSPLAWAHVNGATADLILAGFALDGGSGVTPAANPLTATYAAASMTSVLNWQSGGSGQTSGYLAVLSKTSPATGSNNVSGSFTNTGMDEIIGGSLSFITSGGSLGTPAHSDSGGAAVTSGSITVATTSANSLVAVFVTNGSGGTAFTTGTSRFTNMHTGTAAGGAASVNAATIPGTGGNVTVNWTQTSDFYAAIAVEVLPGGGGPVVGVPAVALPGRTWRRRFQHPQQLPAAPPAPPPPPSGNQPGGRVIYRRPARSVWGGVAAQPGQPLINGTTQPRPVIARRTAARAVIGATRTFTVNGTGGQAVNGTAPDHLVIARRAAARAVWRGTTSSTTNLLAGRTQPPATRQPRRTAARAVWRGFISATTNLLPGQIQPEATRQLARRHPSRASWRGWVSSTVNGSAQPIGAGVVQGLATRLLPRRYPSRAVWHGATAPTSNLLAGSQPGGLVRRRQPARAVTAGTTARTVNQVPTVTGTLPDHLVIARRASARAVWAGTTSRTVNQAPPAAPAGQVQPRATVPVPRRAPARVVWRGQAVPGQQPKPATGGLARRRAAVRGQWHGGAGAPPPGPGAPATGGRVATRRPPNRGQWHGTTTRTSNAPPVAVPAPRQRLTVPRRLAARAWWQGTVSTTVNGEPVNPVLFSLGRARQSWGTGRARQSWGTGRARNG